MSRLQWTGIGLAFLGTALAFMGGKSGVSTEGLSDILLGDALAILAGAAWGATTVVIRTSRLSEVSPIGILSFMTPIFGVLLGAWLLSEPLETSFLGGSTLVILGVILVSGDNVLKRALNKYNTLKSYR